MTVGRPTKYKKEYCEELIMHMEQGFSFESFAGKIKTCKQTIYNWLDLYPEFLDAKNIAFEASRLFWEKCGIVGVWHNEEYDSQGRKTYSQKLNSSAWIFNMKNRFGWTDKKEVLTKDPVNITLNYSLDEEEQEE